MVVLSRLCRLHGPAEMRQAARKQLAKGANFIKLLAAGAAKF